MAPNKARNFSPHNNKNQQKNIMKILNTIEGIKSAVDSGVDVFCDSDAYKVIKGKRGDYFITYTPSGYTIGLHGVEGTEYENKLNGTTFYTK